MTQYIIRTDSQEKKTFILTAKPLSQKLAVIYSDFLLHPDSRDISYEEIISSASKKVMGNIRLFENEKAIQILNKNGRSEIASVGNDGEYHESKKLIAYRRLSKAVLLSNPEYASLGAMGITHAYFMDSKSSSSLQNIFCFERGSDISGVINSKSDSLDSCLAGLSLVLAERIINQDFIFRFMRKS